jgi:cell division protein FtsQ
VTENETPTREDRGEAGAGSPPDEGPDGTLPARTVGPPRRRRRVLLAGLAGVGLVYWVGWHSPVTVVEHVVVDAPRGIPAESIRLASGISAADRVPSVDPEAVRLGIMTAIPAVADVQMERSLPDTIRLTVTSRTPLAAVEAGAGFYVMDPDGVVFDRVKRAKDLPVISAGTDTGREVARAVLLAIPDDLRAKVTRVTARSRDDVTLRLRGGTTVRWGSVEDSELKARVLTGLSAVNAKRIDVSAPLLPTTSGPEDDETGSTS